MHCTSFIYDQPLSFTTVATRLWIFFIIQISVFHGILIESGIEIQTAQIVPRSIPYFLHILVNSGDCPKNCITLYFVCVPYILYGMEPTNNNDI